MVPYRGNKYLTNRDSDNTWYEVEVKMLEDYCDCEKLDKVIGTCIRASYHTRVKKHHEQLIK